jgi:hypothetical protein
MGGGIAKVRQHAIAEVLGHETAVAVDDRVAELMIRLHDRVVVFGVECGGQLRGAHHVAEQHRQLAAFADARSRVAQSRV